MGFWFWMGEFFIMGFSTSKKVAIGFLENGKGSLRTFLMGCFWKASAVC